MDNEAAILFSANSKLLFRGILYPNEMKKWIFLLRAFFPSWRFFAESGADLMLDVRVMPSSSDVGNWLVCLPPISRSLKTLFLNPQGNYLHACRNLLNHFYSDLMENEDPNQIAELVTYKTTHNLVQSQLSKMDLAPTHRFYQFRLTAQTPGSLSQECEEILVSPVYERQF